MAAGCPAPVKLEKTMLKDIEDTLIFVSKTDSSTAFGGFGNDLLNADDDLGAASAAGDSEWRYVPVRRTALTEEKDAAGNFKDFADGDTWAADPYASFNFLVDWG